MTAAHAATSATADGQAALRLHLRGLRKRFGACLALDGIDLTAQGPGMLGIVGPDGAGKTTLLRVLAGLLDFEADAADSMGFDLRADVQQYKRRIGYVPQTFSLYRELSIRENLSFTARLHRLDAPTTQQRCDELLVRTGLAAFADRPAGKLSGGMKQKLAVANALLAHPDLLVLDEPTAGVDVLARREILNMLRSLERDALVVLSTSYLDEAAACDRLVYLARGRIVAEGTPGQLEAATGSEPYRVWTDEAEAVQRAAMQLPWVSSARDCGRFVRVEADAAASPGATAACRVLSRLTDDSGRPLVALAERAPADLESTLLALAKLAEARDA